MKKGKKQQKIEEELWTPPLPWEEESVPADEFMTGLDEPQTDEGLSYEEMQMLRAGIRQSGEDRSLLPPHDQSVRATFFRFAKKNRLVAASVGIIFLAVIFGIVFGAVQLATVIRNRPNHSDFTICLGTEKPYTVSYDEMVRDDVLYIDMKRVAEFTDAMIVSGTKTEKKFTASDGTSLRFTNGSEIAEVNGERVEMEVRSVSGFKTVTAKAVVSADECLIPWQFLLQTVQEGLMFRWDADTNTLTVKHIHYVYDGDKENAEPSKILFDKGNLSVLPSAAVTPEYSWTYTIDIAPYLNSITSENLLLANKSHALGASFRPELSRIDDEFCWGDESHSMQPDAVVALTAMMKEMQAAGVTDIWVTSSYRGYANQNWLYYTYYYEKEHAKHPDWSDEQIYAEISTYSSRPGESEHQTGLCIDFTAKSIGGQLNNTFADTDAFRWLAENAYKFGFILRYPEDKTDITQYSYESWHYRFVGRQAATEMYFSDLCLEEYLSETGE